MTPQEIVTLASGRCLLVEAPLVVHAAFEMEVFVLIAEGKSAARAAVALVAHSGQVEGMMARLVRALGNPNSLRAKIAGGSGNGALVDLIKKSLMSHKVSLVAEECGTPGRRELYAHLPEGRLRISVDPGVSSKEKPMAVGNEGKKKRRRVLVVEDSRTVRDLVKHIIEQEKDLELVGIVESAEEALRALPSSRPDVILLDINLPGMNGLEFLEKLPDPHRTAVIIMSSINPESGKIGLRAFELGAFEYLEKPSLADLKNLSTDLLEDIRNAVPVERCRKRAQKNKQSRSSPAMESSPRKAGSRHAAISLVAVGASTGGTNAIREFFRGLPKKIPPIVVVQHIPPVFSKAFAEELNRVCAFDVKEAEDGDLILPGRALIAPGARQMAIERAANGFRVRLTNDPPLNRHRPSVDYMFASIVKMQLKGVVAFLLTGMGNDGAQGLLDLHKQGARTVAQNEESCVVFGMPRAAIELGAADEIVALEDMADTFLRITG